MRPASALIIHGDAATASRFTEVVRRLGLDAVHAASASETLQHFEQIAPAVMILELAPGDMAAQELLRLARGGHVPVIAIVEMSSLRGGVEAMRAGATDVLDERVPPQELEQAIQAVLPQCPAKYDGEIFGLSPKMQALRLVVAGLAAVSTPVLIRGESGVGKELIARMIHRLAYWSDLSFVKLSCVALPPGKLESELDGIVTLAQDQTVFLDEIGELSAAGQARLLRILAVDDPKPRLIAATSADMYRLVAGGLFRRDLYERLAVATIDVPPLRERREEIDPLVQSFLERFSREFQRPVPPVSESMSKLLRTYGWPGNVRELENIIKRWVVLGSEDRVREEIEARRAAAEHAPQSGTHRGLREIARRAAREAERMVLQDALRRARGNRAAVAREQKISYKTLLQKLTEAGLAPAPRPKRSDRR